MTIVLSLGNSFERSAIWVWGISFAPRTWPASNETSVRTSTTYACPLLIKSRSSTEVMRRTPSAGTAVGCGALGAVGAAGVEVEATLPGESADLQAINANAVILARANEIKRRIKLASR